MAASSSLRSKTYKFASYTSNFEEPGQKMERIMLDSIPNMGSADEVSMIPAG